MITVLTLGLIKHQAIARRLEEAARLVAGSQQTLVLSGWPRELELLADELRAAHQRGIYIVVFSHAALPATIAGVPTSTETRVEIPAALARSSASVARSRSRG